MDLKEQYDKLFKYCYMKTRDRFTSEDIVQETFLKLCAYPLPIKPLYYGTFCNTFMYGRLNNVEASFLIFIICIALMMLILNLTYKRSQVASR